MSKQDSAKAWSPSAAREAARADLTRAIRRVTSDRAWSGDVPMIRLLVFNLDADRAFDDVETFHRFVRVLAGKNARHLRAYDAEVS